MKIVHFLRLKNSTIWSIEKIFEEIRKHLVIDAEVVASEMPFTTQGLVPRIKNILFTRKHKGDINHITGDIHYIALALPGKRTVLTVHDLGFMDQYSGISRFLMWLFWIYIPVHKVKYIVAISEATKKDIIRYARCKPSRIEVIPDFCSPLFTRFPKVFNAQKPVLLQIGTKFNKNVERLFEAIQGIHCKLIIVGKLKDRQVALLNQYSIEYENKFNITENEILELYQNCDMVTFCSLLEGFGLPIMEAQAVGRPIITSTISSMPEVAGTGACLVNPYKVEEIREGILRIISDENYRNTLVENGFVNLKRYSVQHVAALYAQLYRNIKNEQNIH